MLVLPLIHLSHISGLRHIVRKTLTTFLSFVFFSDLISGFDKLNPKVIPQKIDLISTHETSKVSYCTHYQSDGSLMVGTGDGIMVYKDDYSKPQKTLSKHITSIDRNMSVEGGYFFITHMKDSRTVKLTTDCVHMTDEFEFEYIGTRGTFLATFARIIAVIAPKCIKLYSLASKLICIENVDYQPLQIRFDDYGDLLVTGNNAMRKYRLSEDDSGMTMLWSCEELTKAYGLCIMENGVILVISKDGSGSVFLISEEGQMLHN